MLPINHLYDPFQLTLTPVGLDQFGLSLKQSFPCEVLKRRVHSYLQIKTERPTSYPVMPDGTQAIFISPLGSLIGGASLKSNEIQILQPGEYFGIRFYPGALRNFFNLDIAEITGQFADYKFLPCRFFKDLHTQIFRKKAYGERANVCEAWLLKNYNPASVNRLDQALYLIYQSSGNIRISELADKVGWSSRHINRQFLNNTGLNAKTFSQIIRVQTVCRQLYLNPGAYLKIALDAGYYDQAHLIKDFKNRLSMTPRLFLDRLMSDFYNS